LPETAATAEVNRRRGKHFCAFITDKISNHEARSTTEGAFWSAAARCRFPPQSDWVRPACCRCLSIAKLEMCDSVTERCRQQAGATHASPEESGSKLPHSKPLCDLPVSFLRLVKDKPMGEVSHPCEK